jgi:hypothetical protein
MATTPIEEYEYSKDLYTGNVTNHIYNASKLEEKFNNTKSTGNTNQFTVDTSDKRFSNVDADIAKQEQEIDNTYDGMINNSDKFFNDQIQVSKDWADKQTQLQQEQTDFAIEKIEQEKEQSRKDYLKEQSGAYVDWQKQSNQYGVNAEKMASAGLSGTGFSESSQVAMYNQYQNRVATAREVFSKAVLNYNNAIKDAQLQNNAMLAEIAYNALEKQTEIALKGFEYKNNLILEKASEKRELNNTKWARYQDVYNQIANEMALAEDARQFDTNLAFQKEENQKNRDFEATENQKNRDFEATENEKNRDFQAEQAQLDRDHEAKQAQLDRDFEAQQADLDRKHETEQAALDRKHEKEMQEANNKAEKERLQMQHDHENNQLKQQQKHENDQLAQKHKNDKEMANINYQNDSKLLKQQQNHENDQLAKKHNNDKEMANINYQNDSKLLKQQQSNSSSSNSNSKSSNSKNSNNTKITKNNTKNNNTKNTKITKNNTKNNNTKNTKITKNNTKNNNTKNTKKTTYTGTSYKSAVDYLEKYGINGSGAMTESEWSRRRASYKATGTGSAEVKNNSSYAEYIQDYVAYKMSKK